MAVGRENQSLFEGIVGASRRCGRQCEMEKLSSSVQPSGLQTGNTECNAKTDPTVKRDMFLNARNNTSMSKKV